jgi:hypothetical protein
MRLAEVETLGESPKLVAALFRNVMCETILAAGVLLVVGLLGVTPPPMQAMAAESPAPPVISAAFCELA